MVRLLFLFNIALVALCLNGEDLGVVSQRRAVTGPSRGSLVEPPPDSHSSPRLWEKVKSFNPFSKDRRDSEQATDRRNGKPSYPEVGVKDGTSSVTEMPVDAQPPKVPQDQDRAHLRMVAERLGMEPMSNRSAGDLATDIRIFIDDAQQPVPSPLSKDVLNSLKDVLGPADLEAVLERNRFLEQLKTRRVLLLPPRKQ